MLKTLYYSSRTKNELLEPLSFQEKDIRLVTGSATKENVGTWIELSEKFQDSRAKDETQGM